MILAELPDNLGFEAARKLAQGCIIAQYVERQDRDAHIRGLRCLGPQRQVWQPPDCESPCRKDDKRRARKR